MRLAPSTANGGPTHNNDIPRDQWMLHPRRLARRVLGATEFRRFNFVLRPALTELPAGEPGITWTHGIYPSVTGSGPSRAGPITLCSATRPRS